MHHSLGSRSSGAGALLASQPSSFLRLGLTTGFVFLLT